MRPGGLRGQPRRARAQAEAAAAQGADLVVFPELTLHGYALGRVEGGRPVRAGDPRLAALTGPGADVLVGFHEDAGIRRHNAAAYLTPDGPLHVHRKLYLSNYLAWEERKHASPGQCWVVFCNRVGTEAGARFWGGSRVLDPEGRVAAEAPLWDPDLLLVDVDVPAADRRRREVPRVAEARLGLVRRELDRLIEEGGDA